MADQPVVNGASGNGRAAELRRREPPRDWRTAMYVKFINALRRMIGLHLHSVQVGPIEPNAAVPAVPGIDARVLTDAEILAQVGLPQLDFRPAFVTAALARGDVCVGGFEGARLVAYSWRAVTGPVRHDEVWEVTWKPGLVYRYKAFTMPEYRGMHINRLLDATIDRHLAQRGFSTGISFVETTNLSSLRALTRKKRRSVGQAGYFQRFGLHVSFRTPGCRAVGFAFQRRARTAD